jgi:hypothetical protein
MTITGSELIFDLNEFSNFLRKESERIFRLSYKNTDIGNNYTKSMLSITDIRLIIKPYTSRKDHIYQIDCMFKEIILKEINSLMVYRSLSKMSNDGLIELCWDADLYDFVWRTKNNYK